MADAGLADARQILAVLTERSPSTLVHELAGGKGRGLFQLTEAGIEVPSWAIVGVDVLRSFCASTAIGCLIEQEVSDLPEDASDAVLQVLADRVEQAILKETLPGDVHASIAAAYAHVGAGAVAVRSSALDEDGESLSFAGQHKTLLNVIGPDPVASAVRSCWASAWSVDALRYRLLNGRPIGGIGMAVVIQAIVPAEKSGVLFTINPVSGNADELVLSASWGLGEAIVSGSVDPDTYLVDRASGQVEKETLGAKEERVDPLPAGGCEVREVAWEDRVVSVLSPEEIAELRRLGLALEALMDGPQDIEWATAAGKVWILQSRPITGDPQKNGSPDGELRIWDNSNIIESYGEIVAPLTYTFALHVYHGVFREHCELLGVPDRQLAEMEEWLPSLLGYFDGRVYYNLLSWYRLIRLLPFYSINKRVMEIALGAEPLDEDLADRQRPFAVRNALEGGLIKAKTTVRFFWYFCTIHRQVRDFVAQFYRVYGEFEELDYAGRNASDLYGLFTSMERQLLARWGRMTMLETSIGLSFGALYGLTQRWLPDAPDWFLYEAVKTPEVESLQPLLRLDELAQEVLASPALREEVRSLPAEALDEALRTAKEKSTQDLVSRIDSYLKEFGYRNANELKLEEPDLREEPAAFFSLLKSAVGRLEMGEAMAKDERPTADEYIAQHLRGWRRRAYGLVRRRVQKCLADREEVRFCRTRIFGLSRRMFQAAGEELTRLGGLEDPGDVFYLRLDELRGCFEGTINHRELIPTVKLRKEQELQNRERSLPHRFATKGGVYWDALERACAGAKEQAVAVDGRLSGTPCSPGLVRGPARVLERPEDVEGSVLVTYRTDPGWVGVLRSASALVIERGSPLTHVAVVARELGIPTVVQVPGVTQQVRDGMELIVDGAAGSVEICALQQETE